MIERLKQNETSIAAWALRNPYAIFAAFIAIMVGAIAAALFLLPTRMMPYVQSPLISVITMTPGYAPQEVETYFTKPIEERMTDLQGVRYIRSISQQGISIVTLQFPYGTDMRRALVDVQQLAKQAEGDLPYDRANLKPSYVVPVDPLNTPVLQLAVTAAGWDPVRLREFVANDVIDQLKSVPGVQVAFPFGGLQRQLRVDVHRDALAADGLSILDVRDAIDAQNVSRSAGVVTGGASETIVRSAQRADSEQSMLDYPIGTVGNRTIYLRDVASARDTAAEVRAAYRFNGHEAVEVSVVENPDASSPQVIAAVMARVAQIEAQHPGVQFARAYDNSRFVHDLTVNMIEELIISVVLAGIVLLIFLEDVSATFIVMTAIPTCLSLAVILFLPMGLSINSSTLIGLLLAIGRLVDDSIVVIHSVHRKLDEGSSPARAAVDGTMEVIVPIAAATGVMILAVVPLLMSGGITSIMFVGLVWPIVFALLASMVVSVTLTPLLAAYLFQTKEARSLRRIRLDDAVARMLRPTRAALTRLNAGYRNALAWSLDHRALVLAGAALLTYVGIQLLPFIGQEMMPLADTGQAYAFLEMTPGTSFRATDAASRRFETLLQQQPEVQKISAEIGEQAGADYFTGQAMNGVNDASYLITFVPKESRRRTIWQIMDGVYAQATRTIPGIRRLALKEMGSDVMASNNAPIEILIYGPDRSELYRLAGAVADRAKSVRGLYQVATSSVLAQPELQIMVDRTRASQIGLTPADVQMQAYYALHGGITAEYFNPANLRHDTILVRYAQDQRDRTGDVSTVQIAGRSGQVVPLNAIAAVGRASGPSLIEHDGLRPTISVLGFYRKGGPGEMDLDMDVLMSGLAAIPFPQGYGMEMRGDMTEMMQSFDRLLGAMKVAVFFIFLLLVVQFRSVVQPLVMLLAIPLQLLGMFGGLLIAHQSFSTVSILGIVVANGMAVSNAILLLDLILRKRREGMGRREAILYAGPIRLQPILMTTIVSLVVLISVAFFPKTGIDAYSPLATVIIGGLSISTLLTLFVVPVLHDVFDDGVEWLRQRKWGTVLPIILLAVSVALLAKPASAQPLAWSGTLTLAQAIARAQSAGFDVRLAQADADVAGATVSEERAKLLPQVGVSGTTSNGGITQFGTPYARQTYLLATASVPIFAPQALASRRAAGHTAQAAGYMVAAGRSDAMLAAVQTYEYALLTRAIATARTITVEYQQRHVHDVGARVRVGDAARYTLFESEAALAAAKQSLEDAAADRDESTADLEFALDLTVTPALQLADALSPLTLRGDFDAFARRALAQRPEVLAASAALQAAQAQVGAARAAYLPNVTANAQTYNGSSNPPLGATGYQIGVTASVPVIDSGSRTAVFHEAAAKQARAQTLLDQAELSAQRDVAKAWREYQAAGQNLETARAQATSAAEELRVATVRERAGKGTTLETLAALSDDAAAREGVLRAIARLNVSIAAVHRTAGDMSIQQ